MGKTLDGFTTAELQNEINERQRKEKRRAIEERERSAELWLTLRLTLLRLVPKHEPSCRGTDDSPLEQSRRLSCARCFLLRVENLGFWDPDFALTLDIRYAPLGRDD